MRARRDEDDVIVLESEDLGSIVLQSLVGQLMKCHHYWQVNTFLNFWFIEMFIIAPDLVKMSTISISMNSFTVISLAAGSLVLDLPILSCDHCSSAGLVHFVATFGAGGWRLISFDNLKHPNCLLNIKFSLPLHTSSTYTGLLIA